MTIVYVVIGLLLLPFLKNIIANYWAFASGGNLKVCARSVWYLSETTHHDFKQAYLLRLNTILKQCRHKSWKKKSEIVMGARQILNFTDLAIFDYFCNLEADSVYFEDSLSRYRTKVRQYLQEYGVDQHNIDGNHEEEIKSIQHDITYLFVTYDYPSLADIYSSYQQN